MFGQNAIVCLHKKERLDSYNLKYWFNRRTVKLMKEFRSYAAFPQLMESSIKLTITLGGGISINCIYYTIFSKVLCLSFCQIPSPYQGRHMQMCGNPDPMNI